MNTKLLKQKILDLAIRGKLTQQLKSDGTAADLLKEIADAKSALSQPKGKKSRDLGQIIPLDKNEAPFEIPANWEWVRLGNVCKVFGRIGFRGYTKKDLVEKGEGAISLSPSNMDEMKLNFDRCTYISWFKYEESPEIMINKGDIIVVKTGSSYGKTSIVQDLPEKTTLNPQLMVLKQINCNRNYLCYFLNSAYFRKVFEELVNGTAIPTFSQEKFSSKEFPLPPLAEQQRIVEKIQEAFAEIDSIENNKELLKTHIKQARQKILDLAIHGKLVPQNKNDEPASVLLERITRDNPHYEKLADAPFEIPDSWEWVKLGDICKLQSGSTIPQSQECDEGTMMYIKVSDMNLPENLYEIKKSQRYVNQWKECQIINANSIIFPKRGGAILTNKKRIVREPVLTDLNIMGITPIACFDYIYWWFMNIDLGLLNNGSNIPQLNNKDIAPLLLPLPPLAEQKRIVDKIEEIFASLDEISLHLV